MSKTHTRTHIHRWRQQHIKRALLNTKQLNIFKEKKENKKGIKVINSAVVDKCDFLGLTLTMGRSKATRGTGAPTKARRDVWWMGNFALKAMKSKVVHAKLLSAPREGKAKERRVTVKFSAATAIVAAVVVVAQRPNVKSMLKKGRDSKCGGQSGSVISNCTRRSLQLIEFTLHTM